MSVDVQRIVFIMLFVPLVKNPQDESMLIECGRLYTWDDVF